MAFDLGGFTGSFVGTLGAYLIARATFEWNRAQNRPKALSLQMELAQEVLSVLYMGHQMILGKPFASTHDALEYVLEKILKPLDMLSAKAVSVNKMFPLIRETKHDVMRVWAKYMPVPEGLCDIVETEHLPIDDKLRTGQFTLEIFGIVSTKVEVVEDLVRSLEEQAYELDRQQS